MCAPAPLSALARADTLLLPPTDRRENFIRVQASSGGERHTAFPLWYVEHRIPMAQSTIRSEVTPCHRQVRRGLPGPGLPDPLPRAVCGRIITFEPQRNLPVCPAQDDL